MNLRWMASMSASGFHAVDVIRRGWTPTDQALVARFAPLVEEFDELDAATLPENSLLPPGGLWRWLLSHCADAESNARLARTALAKAIGTEAADSPTADRLIRAIDALEAEVRQIFPRGVDELALRGEPLKMQWEARGPGILAEIGRLTDRNLIAPQASVVLVQPIVGGFGAAHLDVNAVWFEAVLTDVVAEVPEVVRLGWSLAQLQCEIPIFGERVPGNQLPRVASLAMVPSTLAAAEVVQLAQFDEPTLRTALEKWRLTSTADEAAALAEILLTWWATYTSSKPHWSIALAALHQMLPDEATIPQ